MKDITANTVNAVCVRVEDLGVVETPFGMKPQVKFSFETDETNPYGDNRVLTRIFNNCTYEKSALSMAVKSWCGRDLTHEKQNGGVDLQSFIGVAAKLELQPITTRDGGTFDKINQILPSEDEQLIQA